MHFPGVHGINIGVMLWSATWCMYLEEQSSPRFVGLQSYRLCFCTPWDGGKSRVMELRMSAIFHTYRWSYWSLPSFLNLTSTAIRVLERNRQPHGVPVTMLQDWKRGQAESVCPHSSYDLPTCTLILIMTFQDDQVRSIWRNFQRILHTRYTLITVSTPLAEIWRVPKGRTYICVRGCMILYQNVTKSDLQWQDSERKFVS